MKMILMLMQLVVNIFICTIVVADSRHAFLHLEHENAAVVATEDTKPFLNETTGNEIECHLKCLANRNKCCLVQLEAKNDDFHCSLYSTSLKYVSLVAKKQAKLYSIISKSCTPVKDCKDWLKNGMMTSGVYDIQVAGKPNKRAFCDMLTDGGGWTVLQRRFDGTVSFNRPWSAYKEGFGDPNGEYWLGNELIHELTQHQDTSLRIEGTSFDGRYVKVIYNGFYIENEANGYRLHTGIRNVGNFFKAWLSHNGGVFSAGNDTRCSRKYLGGWWWKGDHCISIYLNGIYLDNQSVPSADLVQRIILGAWDSAIQNVSMSMRRNG